MKKYSNSELCLIWLDSFLGLEYVHKQALYKMINGKADIKSLIVGAENYIRSKVGDNAYNTLLSSANADYLSHVIEELKKREIIVVTIESIEYPKLLKDTAIPPLVLYCKGNINLLTEKCFGIVGSRKSLPLSISLAKEYASAISDGGFTLVSGIAEGVDSAVLEYAIKNKRKVISVLAGGFDNLYPKSNYELLEKVIKVGLAISEHPPEIKPMPFHFPIRNRIIAGLSKGVLVVSAGAKSGTLYTAEYAEEYGRDVFAVPYSVGIYSGVGCNELIKRGAILTDTPEDITAFYGIENNKDTKVLSLTEDEKLIVNILKDGEAHVEKIEQALKKPTRQILGTLSMLEIKKIVVKRGTNVYGLIRLDLEA